MVLAWLLLGIHQLQANGALYAVARSLADVASGRRRRPAVSVVACRDLPSSAPDVVDMLAALAAGGYSLAAFVLDVAGLRWALVEHLAGESQQYGHQRQHLYQLAARAVLHVSLVLQFLGLVGTPALSCTIVTTSAAWTTRFSRLGYPVFAGVHKTWPWLLLVPVTLPTVLRPPHADGAAGKGGIRDPLSAAQAVAAVLLCVLGVLGFALGTHEARAGVEFGMVETVLAARLQYRDRLDGPAARAPASVPSPSSLIGAAVLVFWPLLGGVLLWQAVVGGWSASAGADGHVSGPDSGGAWRLAVPWLVAGGHAEQLWRDPTQMLTLALVTVYILWRLGVLRSAMVAMTRGVSAGASWRLRRKREPAHSALGNADVSVMTVPVNNGRRLGPQETLLPLFVED